MLLSLALKWGDDAFADPRSGLHRALATVTCEPVRVLGNALGSLAASAGRLVEGGVGDVCVFDPLAQWRVDPKSAAQPGAAYAVRRI